MSRRKTIGSSKQARNEFEMVRKAHMAAPVADPSGVLLCLLYDFFQQPIMAHGYWTHVLPRIVGIPWSSDLEKLDAYPEQLWLCGPNLRRAYLSVMTVQALEVWAVFLGRKMRSMRGSRRWFRKWRTRRRNFPFYASPSPSTRLSDPR